MTLEQAERLADLYVKYARLREVFTASGGLPATSRRADRYRMYLHACTAISDEITRLADELQAEMVREEVMAREGKA